MWTNVGEVWESVLGCRGSSLKRGVGEVRSDWDVKKCGRGVRKYVAGVGGRCGGVGKYGGGVEKCFGCGRK